MGLAADPKAERAKEGRADTDELGPVWVFKINGELHRIYHYRVTSNDVAEYRQATGKSFRLLGHQSLDLDVYAAFLWFEARQNGSVAPFAMAPVLTGADECEMLAEDPEQSAEVGSPEG